MQPETELQLPAAPAVKALACPACGGSVALRAAGYSVSVVCQYCSSILDVTDPQVKLITEYRQAAEALEIPLGSRGTLRGIEWEAIGYLQRSAAGGGAWDEYLLFNPYHGYRWLITDGRGWSLGEQLTVSPSYSDYETMLLGDRAYTRFYEDSTARVNYVLGEFYWRVAVGEEVVGADWVRPGSMLSREKNAHEVSWTRSILLDHKEMAEAFGVQKGASWPPMPHQPSPNAAWLGTGFKIFAGMFLLLTVLILAFGGTSWVTAGRFPIASDGTERTVTLGPIHLGHLYQRVEIRADVPRLENGWVDLDYTLVDRKTQQVYEAYGAAERYSGSDSDGPWTEGSRRSSISVASVPAGDYDLVVDYKGNRWNSSTTWDYARGVSVEDPGWLNQDNQPEVVVEVRGGALFASSFFIALLLLGLPLLIGLIRHIQFDKARQAESDFAPTGFAALTQSSEDDEE
ncbi:DUF4178 domain-containing protein [Sphingomonas sp. NIBR02145]|uniref:DUF4178 domain-containing protein n=1 Tax=Sphingomonas sp. NIBR02145 TaxID=3014784 RepID=UPI0022B536C8|nr:DUF4178 domain-containing protein [Sphingomonas sp. NIBR02145]WHU02133.1 DUF4178 domain-containing protein [Sphingomonas sp. NIBR02145]